LNADPETPETLASRLVMVAPDGTQTTVIDSGLTFATGLAIGPDGSQYISNFGLMPGMGQVLMIAPS
jgi:sugar lactone lactonase YvrE